MLILVLVFRLRLRFILIFMFGLGLHIVLRLLILVLVGLVLGRIIVLLYDFLHLLIWIDLMRIPVFFQATSLLCRTLWPLVVSICGRNAVIFGLLLKWAL